jgi:hypothetical protein
MKNQGNFSLPKSHHTSTSESNDKELAEISERIRSLVKNDQ